MSDTAVSRDPALWGATVARGIIAGGLVYGAAATIGVGSGVPLAVGVGVIAAALPLLYHVYGASASEA